MRCNTTWRQRQAEAKHATPDSRTACARGHFKKEVVGGMRCCGSVAGSGKHAATKRASEFDMHMQKLLRAPRARGTPPGHSA